MAKAKIYINKLEGNKIATEQIEVDMGITFAFDDGSTIEVSADQNYINIRRVEPVKGKSSTGLQIRLVAANSVDIGVGR